MSYKFGCALHFNMFTDEPSEGAVQLCDSFCSKNRLLEYCAKNFDTVELRTVK